MTWSVHAGAFAAAATAANGSRCCPSGRNKERPDHAGDLD
jgi:hypothetical protein